MWVSVRSQYDSNSKLIIIIILIVCYLRLPILWLEGVVIVASFTRGDIIPIGWMVYILNPTVQNKAGSRQTNTLCNIPQIVFSPMCDFFRHPFTLNIPTYMVSGNLFCYCIQSQDLNWLVIHNYICLIPAVHQLGDTRQRTRAFPNRDS